MLRAREHGHATGVRGKSHTSKSDLRDEGTNQPNGAQRPAQRDCHLRDRAVGLVTEDILSHVIHKLTMDSIQLQETRHRPPERNDYVSQHHVTCEKVHDLLIEFMHDN